MRIAQRETSISCYYDHVIPCLAAGQNERVMAVIEDGRNYSLTELTWLVPGIDKSSMSRCVNQLRTAGRLECAPDRKCTVTGITITPSRLPRVQKELF